MSTTSGKRVGRMPSASRQLFDGEGRVGVHAAITCFMGAPRRGHQRLRIVELGEQTVDGRSALMRLPPCTCASGSSVRISKIEIIGKKRMNKNKRHRNRPIVPAKVAQSQNVG